MMLTVTQENFAEQVEQAKKPVLLEFWAPWCVHCNHLAPVLDELDKKVGDSLIIAKVNTDEQQALAAKLQIEYIPTLFVVKNGQASDPIVSPASLEQLETWLKQQGAM